MGRLAIVAGSVFIACAAQPGYGQEAPGRWEFFGYYGEPVFEGTLGKSRSEERINEVRARFVLGGGVRYRINDWIGIEGAFGWIRERSTTSFGEDLVVQSDGDLMIYRGDLSLLLPRLLSTVEPYLSAGAGWFGDSLTPIPADEQLGHVAAGIQIPVLDVVGVRLEVSSYLSTFNRGSRFGRTEDSFQMPLVLQAGVFFRPGSPHR